MTVQIKGMFDYLVIKSDDFDSVEDDEGEEIIAGTNEWVENEWATAFVVLTSDQRRIALGDHPEVDDREVLRSIAGPALIVQVDNALYTLLTLLSRVEQLGIRDDWVESLTASTLPDGKRVLTAQMTVSGC
jgi:hypothetical protein